MLTFAVETTTHTTCTCRGSPASSFHLAREGTFRNCLNNLRRSGCDCVAAFTHPSHIVNYAPGDSFNRALSRAERLDYLLIWQFLKVSAICPVALRLPGLLLRRPDKRSAIRRCYLRTALQQHRLNMADGTRRVQPLRTHTDAVHDAMAAEYAESVT